MSFQIIYSARQKFFIVAINAGDIFSQQMLIRGWEWGMRFEKNFKNLTLSKVASA